MGLFTKSIFVVLVALTTPLIYRQFATDNTIKFMSSYYSNYKIVDQFLRQSASHLDRAREYLPNSEQIEASVGKFNAQINSMVGSVANKLSEDTTTSGVSTKQEAGSDSISYVQCPGDSQKSKLRLFSREELSMYDGKVKGRDILLGFLGQVYDVSSNGQHYTVGAEYNAFAGRDATRAFVTGNFTHDLHDDISGLEDSLFQHLDSWASFYSTNYPIVGRIKGNFYDSKGCPTEELKRMNLILKRLGDLHDTEIEKEKEFPECNSEWNSDLKKGKVWCSTKSGGIERDWAGVPRIYYGGETQRCACVHEERLLDGGLKDILGEYPKCNPKASECPIFQ